ncbi:hypothetical protein [Ornithinicoccus halotolerans]|uniref:hypothetical protein n=1 Tax=Ornithinicoccus halotolerans TaxID=1748220 RepID=UPI00129658DA|nr:hypothetical protein [Ornithinicoccus halotolerans]
MPVSATSQWVKDGRFQPGALIMLQQGTWVLSWPLDERITLRLDIQRVPQDQVETLKVVHPRRDADALARIGTEFPGAQVDLNPVERYQLAHMFVHLINDQPAPGNLVTAAAAGIGDNVAASEIKQRAHRVMRRVNKHRGVPLKSLHELGEYLVSVSGVLTAADLEEPFPPAE